MKLSDTYHVYSTFRYKAAGQTKLRWDEHNTKSRVSVTL